MNRLTEGDESALGVPWMGVGIRHMAALSAVARTRSFRRAADELGYAQPAVSHQLAALERIVGVTLVERQRGRGVASLTHAGELLARRGESVLGRLQAARIDAHAARNNATAAMRIAVLRELAATVLERLLPAIAERIPTIALDVAELQEDGTPCQRVEDGAADIAVDIRPDAPPLTGVILFQDPLELVVRADWPVGRRGRQPTSDELVEFPLLVPTGTVAVSQLAVAGIPVDEVISVPVACAVPALVAAGHGAGLIPRSQLGALDDALVAVPMSGLLPPRFIALCWHPARLRSALRAAVCDVVSTAFQPIADDQVPVA